MRRVRALVAPGTRRTDGRPHLPFTSQPKDVMHSNRLLPPDGDGRRMGGAVRGQRSFETLAQAIAASSDKLVHFHVSDNDRGVPGSGHVPWDQVQQGLTAAGYDGWITAEMFVIAGNPASADLNIWRNIEPDAQRAAAESLAFMKATFA